MSITKLIEREETDTDPLGLKVSLWLPIEFIKVSSSQPELGFCLSERCQRERTHCFIEPPLHWLLWCGRPLLWCACFLLFFIFVLLFVLFPLLVPLLLCLSSSVPTSLVFLSRSLSLSPFHAIFFFSKLLSNNFMSLRVFTRVCLCVLDVALHSFTL